MTSVRTRHLFAWVFLLVSVVALIVAVLSASPARAEDRKKSDEPVALIESWPEESFQMWLPPQQGRLEFSGPIRTSTMTLSLEALDPDSESPGEVTRLTRGEAATRILFRFPLLEEGQYQLSYKAEAVSGEEVSGAVTFSLGPKFTAPGGGNHRHGGTHIEYDTPWHLFVRVLLVLASSVLFFAVYRSRHRFTSLMDAILPRAAALLMLAYALLAGATTIVKSTLDNPDSALAAAFASPALWVFVPLFVASALIVVTGARGRVAAAVAVAALLLSGFSSQHGDQSWAIIATIALTLLLASSALLLSTMWISISNMVAPAPRPTGPALGALAGLGAVSASLSMLMVVAHARGLTFYGDLAADAAMRGVAAGVLAVGIGALIALSLVPVAVLRRVFVVIPALLVVGATVALLWVPPPSSGL